MNIRKDKDLIEKCRNCMVERRGDCSGAGEICDDYEPTLSLSLVYPSGKDRKPRIYYFEWECPVCHVKKYNLKYIDYRTVK